MSSAVAAEARLDDFNDAAEAVEIKSAHGIYLLILFPKDDCVSFGLT